MVKISNLYFPVATSSALSAQHQCQCDCFWYFPRCSRSSRPSQSFVPKSNDNMFQSPYPPYDPTDRSGWVDTYVITRQMLIAPIDSRKYPFLTLSDVASWLGYRSRYETVFKRWPIILTSIIDHVHRLLHDMTLEVQQARDSDIPRAEELSKKIAEGQAIISDISRLKYRMARDHELEWVSDD